MPKRRRSDRGGGRTKNRRRQHLYLVFDDWSQGYTIRKINLSSGNDSDDSTPPPLAVSGEGAGRRLPKPFFRLEAPHGLPQYISSAFGTRIMALHPREPAGADADDGRRLGLGLVPESSFPIFDVRSRGVIFGPRPKTYPARPIYLPVGDMLFALGAGSFELLAPPPLEQPGGGGWCLWSAWWEPPPPPFERRHVTSYAVHPADDDGALVVVSVETRGGGGGGAATFTFDYDMGAETFGWKRRGEWAMPFTGRAHFDDDLGGFVGLCKDPEAAGHLCSCGDAAAGDAAPPAWKLGKESLFSKDPGERHVGATLVYMGRKSRFCLVQCVAIEDPDSATAAGGQCYVYRLSTFSLCYGENGDLTTGNSRRVRCYKVPGKASAEFLLESPVAFWL
ncbi:unnamed protein product [Urochloa humidicola]